MTQAHRDVILPDGIGPKQFDELRALFNERADPDCDKTNSDFALEAIAIIRRYEAAQRAHVT